MYNRDGNSTSREKTGYREYEERRVVCDLADTTPYANNPSFGDAESLNRDRGAFAIVSSFLLAALALERCVSMEVYRVSVCVIGMGHGNAE